MHKKIIAIIVLVVVILSSFGVYYFFFDTQRIEPKQYLCESVSPNFEYTINAYIDDGNATEGYSVLCVLYEHDGGRKIRNIYWNQDCDYAEIEWLSDTSVIINGTKLDNVLKDKYDFRYSKDDLTFQNQYLNNFGVDFISSKCKKVESDELKKYLTIKLNETENQKMNDYASKFFCGIANHQSAFDYLCETQKKNFSVESINIKNGYFSFYNKVSEKIVDVETTDFGIIDTDFYTLIIYDADNNEIHLYDFNLS